ncbi:hypothetical protein [Legionella impletisoli]|uniref:hypothetical protein n=1 Tax=Legionella impletisoli TaxID=343510 RepID=UPI0013EF8968|nr:hypothetical protein [Legionella impletisoli]
MVMKHPIHMVFGLVIWAVWFVILYAALSISCEASVDLTGSFNWINLLLFGFTLVTLAVLIGLAYRIWIKNRQDLKKKTASARFIFWLSFGVYLVAMGTTGSIGLMSLFFPPCL